MTNEEAIITLQANVIFACEKAGFDKATMRMVEDALSLAISALERERWIPIKTRPMDDEERKEWSEKLGYDIEYEDAVIYVSQLPDDGQDVLVCKKWGGVSIDTFGYDPDYGVYFEENGDMDGIIAWMPLPEPPMEETP